MQENTIRGQNFATTSGLLTATGAVTTHDTTVTICYSVNGKALTKTAITTGTTPTTDANTLAAITLTASKARTVVWCLDAAGAVKAVGGPIVDWDGVAFKIAPDFGPIPDTLTPIAYQILKAASTLSGTWTFGSSNWNTAGLTAGVPVNVFVLPSRPQIS